MKSPTPSRTELSSLGEFGLIAHLTQTVKLQNETSLLGIGDDAAVIANVKNRTLVSTKIFIENIHFDLTYVPLRHLGYKVAMANISNLVAMNATAHQMVLSIGVSNRFSVEAMEELYEGFCLACKRYKIDLVGGDTSSNPTGLCLSVTVIGQANDEDLVYRHGAQENDLLCVTGDLGGAYAGLLILERNKIEYLNNPNMQPELLGYEYVLERQLKPEARVDMLHFFAEKQIKPTSMIDISKGLASEVLHLCKASNLGCRLYEDKIPIDPLTCSIMSETQVVPTIAALNGGEDYELLFTVSQKDFEVVSASADITVIGHMVEPALGANLVPQNGPLLPITAQGWEKQ